MKDHSMSPNEWKMFNYQKKIDKQFNDHRYYCKNCGHSMIIKPKEDRRLCDHCGNYIYRTDDLEKEYKQRDFERKLKNYLKRSNEDANRVARGFVGRKSNSQNRKKNV